MAWRFVGVLKKLYVSKNGGSPSEITNVTMPGLRSVDAAGILTRGNQRYYDDGYFDSVSQPDQYNAVAGLLDSNLNLIDYWLQMSVNDYLDIWNPEVGSSYKIRMTRKSGNYLEVRFYSYSQNTSSRWSFSIAYSASWLVNQVNIGFTVDRENSQANFYILNKHNQRLAENEYLYSYTCQSIDAYEYTYIVYPCILNLIYDNEIVPPEPSEDPYADGGFSETGGGGGDFDDSSDAINLPSVPSLNLTLNHFISAYVPSLTDIDNLADWIWGNYDKFDSNKVLGKLFTEPMDSILSLHMLPYTPSHSTAITVTIGNFSTALQMSPLSKQFEDIDCGSLSFSEFWGNYLDYNPYTKIVLCLPFVGQVDLDADEVMGKTIKVKYRVDSLTGAFVCFVYIDSDKILGQYSGECMLQVPVTAASYAQMNAAIASIACTAAAGFGGATAAAIGGGYGGMIGIEKGLQMGGQALGETLASGASNVNGMKLQVSHSGALTGTAGFLGVMKPYAIIHRPRQCVPEKYNEMAGYPSNVTMTLGDCSGFTSVRTMVYDGLPFTDGEILALDSILKGGVII